MLWAVIKFCNLSGHATYLLICDWILKIALGSSKNAIKLILKMCAMFEISDLSEQNANLNNNVALETEKLDEDPSYSNMDQDSTSSVVNDVNEMKPPVSVQVLKRSIIPLH